MCDNIVVDVDRGDGGMQASHSIDPTSEYIQPACTCIYLHFTLQFTPGMPFALETYICIYVGINLHIPNFFFACSLPTANRNLM